MAKAEVMESVAAQYAISEQGEEQRLLPLQKTTEQKVSEYINKHSYTDLAQENRNTFQQITYQEEQSLMYTPLYLKQKPNHYPNQPPDGAKQPQQKDEMQQASHVTKWPEDSVPYIKNPIH